MSKRSEAAESLFEGGRADRIQNQIDPAPAGNAISLRGKILRRIIDCLIGSILLDQLGLGLARHGADHASSGSFGDLDRNDPDPARRRMNQDGLSGTSVMSAMEHVPGGQN